MTQRGTETREVTREREKGGGWRLRVGWEQVCEWRGTKAQSGSKGQSWGSSVEEVGRRGERVEGKIRTEGTEG